jgi:3-hydroxyisobutyrate dehydrogenase-like beta-hydroxyacid dehydrogenase
MVKNMVEQANLTNPIILYNRTASRADTLAITLGPSKAKAVGTIQQAVEASDIIFTCVGDDKAIQETINTALSCSNIKGKLFVDCSTVHPDTTDKVAKLINDHGAEFVACPVFGAPAMADAGQLVCVLAGPAEAVEKVKPYTTGVMGRAVIDYSNQPHGSATRLKIIGNTFILNMVETLSEGHTLAEKSGLGSDRLHQFVETMFPGPYTAYSNRLRQGDYHKREEPLFAVDLARKDAGHAMALAKTHGMRMKDVEVADAHLAGVQKHMGARGDIAGIYGAVRQEAGLEFEN